jgi:4-hydroxy-4-methyl-2-oxoglutarate aldolase
LLTEQALAKRAAGLVIDGFVRDAATIVELGFPVFARGLAMGGTNKEKLGQINRPITCGGVAISPGDIVVGDRDGVVAVAAATATEALCAARRREQSEELARERYRAGETSWSSDGLCEKGAQLGLIETHLDAR